MSDMELSTSEKDASVLRSEGESFYLEAKENTSQSNSSCS